MQTLFPYTRVRAVWAVLLLLFVGLACEDGDDTNADAVEEPVTEMASDLNMLTDAERAEGWELLFDGESFDGWRGFKQDSIPAGWMIEDGALYFNGETSGDILTEDEYENFELAFDWKISEAGNSGVMFRADEDHDYPWMTGPEFQVLDNAGHPDAQNGPKRQAGANYDMHPPTSDVTRPVGEWNEVRIVANGPHVEHWMNGQKIVEYELWTDEWKEMVAGSKWNEHPDYGMLKSGHIVLQDHGDPVWYRNIKIKPLEGADAGAM